VTSDATEVRRSASRPGPFPRRLLQFVAGLALCSEAGCSEARLGAGTVVLALGSGPATQLAFRLLRQEPPSTSRRAG